MPLFTTLLSGGGFIIEKERLQSYSVEQDYAYCEEIIKEHSKSFYFAFSKLPKEKARAIYAVYAFCRLADDSIDEAETKAQQAEALNSLNNQLAQFEQGNEPVHPIWSALRDVFNRYDMSIEAFYDQLQGQAMDYHFEQPHSMKEVEDYSYYVAGSVGLMVLPIIATENHFQLEEAAVDLGIAMQLTNILRDIGEDCEKNNRIYLPADLMLKVGYSIDDLRLGRVNESFIVIWESMAVRAEHLYLSFKNVLHLCDEDSQFPVALSLRVYASILDAVRQNNYDCFNKRNKTSFLKKMCILNEVKKEFIEH